MKIILLSILAISLFVTACAPSNTSPIDTTPAREIQVQAYQYGFEPSIIDVKKGERIRLVFTSKDVPHGVFIMDGIDKATNTFGKGQTEIIEFTADKAGTFTMQCSVYCGAGHTNMQGKIVVSE